MNKSDIESFIELKFFPIENTLEYEAAIPFPVKKKLCKLEGYVQPLPPHEVEHTFSFLMKAYRNRVTLNSAYHAQRNKYVSGCLRQALIEYYEQN